MIHQTVDGTAGLVGLGDGLGSQIDVLEHEAAEVAHGAKDFGAHDDLAPGR